jgi:transcriptional regulator with XRE-family HTH domain
LVAALREVRGRCGITSRDLSLRLGYSHGVVSHWETGRRVPTPEDVATLLGALGIIGQERDRILNLARHAAEPNWLTIGMPGLPRQLAGAVECERSADAIIDWSPTVVPGLLQTSEYARALCAAAGLAPSDVEPRVMIRVGRREILTRTTAPVGFTALISEAALRQPIGTPQVMVEQLRFLVEAGRRPNIEIQVMPQFIEWHPGLAGPFLLYRFPEAPEVVHFEHFSSGAFVPDVYDVKMYRAAVDIMRHKALSVEDSLRRIVKIGKYWERSV